MDLAKEILRYENPNHQKLKVLIALNTAWNLVNFRLGLIRALQNAGYEVVAVAPWDEKYVSYLVKSGCRFEPLSMDNMGTNPIRDLFLLWCFYRLLKRERPAIYLGFTVKPNIYGSIAAHILGIPVINNIAGLGSLFMKNNWLTFLVSCLYKVALLRSVRVFFQNNEDQNIFISNKLVAENLADRLPGSGVDLIKFSAVPLPKKRVIRFLLVSRMLWDKGVGEFIDATRLLKRRGIDLECCLLGFLEVQNPAAILRQQIQAWENEGVIRYLGASEDVRQEIAQADCIVLPSFYREGTPRVLLEAAAMARPIITADSVGCRDVVEDGVSGFLCRPKDAFDLADKMLQVAAMSHVEREVMGLRGREKVEREFDERTVINKYLIAIKESLH